MYNQTIKEIATEIAKYSKTASQISKLSYQLSAAYRAAVAASQFQEAANTLYKLSCLMPQVQPEPLQPVPKKTIVRYAEVLIIDHN